MKGYNIIIALFVVTISSCHDNDIKRMHDGFLVESDWQQDTVPHGRTIYYNPDGKISSIHNFHYGLKHGSSVYFYDNGHISDSMNYENGYLENYFFKFDEGGLLKHKSNYKRGFQIGPSLNYNNGKLESYSFSTFEQFPLFYFSVNDSFAVNGMPYYVTKYNASIGHNEVLGVFAYLVHSPLIFTDFTLLLKDSLGLDYIEIRKYNKNEFMIDTLLYLQKGEKYYLKTDYYDSIAQKGHVYMSEIN